MTNRSSAYEQILERHDVGITANRLTVLRTISENFSDAFSLSDVERLLPTADRSTIFRTLTILAEAHMLHEIDDGSGKHKYCLCHHDDTLHCQGHIHLTCRSCGRTFCLQKVRIPSVPLPKGFVVEDTEYIVKGICNECSRHKTTH